MPYQPRQTVADRFRTAGLVVGPVCFIGAWLAAGVMTKGYSPIRDHISDQGRDVLDAQEGRESFAPSGATALVGQDAPGHGAGWLGRASLAGAVPILRQATMNVSAAASSASARVGVRRIA